MFLADKDQWKFVFFKTLLLILVLTYALIPPLYIAILLKAEGPLWLLFSWIGVTVTGFFFLSLMKGVSLFRILILTCSVMGFSIILIQLNVARRSLAEAWLELVREGRGFGFFSFFTAELTSLFSILSATLLLFRGPLAGTAALLCAGSLVYGILYQIPWALLVSVPLALFTAVAAGKEAEGSYFKNFLARGQRIFLPFLVAGVLSFPFAFITGLSDKGALFRVVDFTPLVIRLFPSLPLLLDVPGYGYGVGASKLSRTVYLSDAPLFSAQGPAKGPVQGPDFDSFRDFQYLPYAVFGAYNGSGWVEMNALGRDIPLLKDEDSAETYVSFKRLRLRLEADFYDRIPLPRGTVAVQFRTPPPELSMADELRGIRFNTGGVRGLQVEIFYGDPQASSARGDDPALYTDPGPDPGGRIEGLARTLYHDDEDTDRAKGMTVERILDYLRNDFSYSLNLQSWDEEKAMERFLFEDKSGYCLYFAGAAVLLARHAGIPARLVEGFLLKKNELGYGSLRGVDSHAWPEFYLDGQWVAVEATPPFSVGDPFRYLSPADRAARRQLTLFFGEQTGEKRPTQNGKDHQDVVAAMLRVLLILVALGLGILLFQMCICFSNPLWRLKRRAKALIRRGRRSGIEGPERSGWTIWALAMDDPEAQEIAETLLSLTFDPEAATYVDSRPISRRKPIPSK